MPVLKQLQITVKILDSPFEEKIMKILLVTSEVTFVPENYNHFLEQFFEGIKGEKDVHIELAIFKNNTFLLSLRGFALMAMGAKSIGFHLLRNSIKARFKDRNKLCSHHGIKIVEFQGPNTPEFIEYVKKNEIDLVINARTRFIYKSKALKAPKLACLNIHHGILPDNRGTMCDLWAVYEGRPTGFTIHFMEKKIDAGKIIRVKETSSRIKETIDHYPEILLKSSQIEGKELAQLVKDINKNGEIPIHSDNHSTNAIYTKNPDFLTIRKMLQKGIRL